MDRCALFIDLKNLEKNYKTLSKLSAITAVVKGDAYGLGAEEIVKCLDKCGEKSYAVATVYEGQNVRLFTSNEIIVLGFIEDWNIVKKCNLTPVVYDDYSLKKAREAGVKMYIKINTGMNRLGFRSIESIKMADDILGFMSHFSSADGEADTSKEVTKEQYNMFLSICKNTGKKMMISNSAGLFCGYGLSGARVGIALYGISENSEILPVVSLKSRVIAKQKVLKNEYIGYSLGYRADRDMEVAIVSIGYADGLFRNLSNKLTAYVKGQKIHSVGYMSMDSMAFDITGLDIDSFQEVEIINQHQSVMDIAKISDTIPYEVLTHISKRVKRVYLE